MIKIEFERMDEKIMEYQLVKIRTVFTEDDIESVSYTHLDVYKRQAMHPIVRQVLYFVN